MAHGGFGRVSRPTLFLAGEAGPEDVAFSGANKEFGGGDMSGLVSEVRRMQEEMKGLRRDFSFVVPAQIAKATMVALVKAGVR